MILLIDVICSWFSFTIRQTSSPALLAYNLATNSNSSTKIWVQSALYTPPLRAVTLQGDTSNTLPRSDSSDKEVVYFLLADQFKLPGIEAKISVTKKLPQRNLKSQISFKGKGKGKTHLIRSHEGPEGEIRGIALSFL